MCANAAPQTRYLLAGACSPCVYALKPRSYSWPCHESFWMCALGNTQRSRQGNHTCRHCAGVDKLSWLPIESRHTSFQHSALPSLRMPQNATNQLFSACRSYRSAETCQALQGCSGAVPCQAEGLPAALRQAPIFQQGCREEPAEGGQHRPPLLCLLLSASMPLHRA